MLESVVAKLDSIADELQSMGYDYIALAVDRTSDQLEKIDSIHRVQEFVEKNENKIKELILSAINDDYSHSFIGTKSFKSIKVKPPIESSTVNLWVELDSKYILRAKGSRVSCYTDDISINITRDQLKRIDPDFKI